MFIIFIFAKFLLTLVSTFQAPDNIEMMQTEPQGDRVGFGSESLHF